MQNRFPSPRLEKDTMGLDQTDRSWATQKGLSLLCLREPHLSPVPEWRVRAESSPEDLPFPFLWEPNTRVSRNCDNFHLFAILWVISTDSCQNIACWLGVMSSCILTLCTVFLHFAMWTVLLEWPRTLGSSLRWRWWWFRQIKEWWWFRSQTLYS